jgi:hypothetical protein
VPSRELDSADQALLELRAEGMPTVEELAAYDEAEADGEDDVPLFEEGANEPPPDQAPALRLAFGTRPPRSLKPAKQHDLFRPDPQLRLKL